MDKVPTTPILYTDEQGVDEAVLMLTRRLRRLHPDIYVAVVHSLPQGLQDALTLAEHRADTLRHNDRAAGIVRKALTIAEIVASVMGDDDEDAEVER